MNVDLRGRAIAAMNSLGKRRRASSSSIGEVCKTRFRVAPGSGLRSGVYLRIPSTFSSGNGVGGGPVSRLRDRNVGRLVS